MTDWDQPDPNQFWHEISFRINQPDIEFAETALQTLGSLSITLNDAGDQPILEPAPGTTPTWPELIVTGLFAQEHVPETLLNNLKAALKPIPHSALQLNKLENRSWERAWLDNFKPMRFGERLWIYPNHIPPADDTTANVILDPGLAFGTGTHPTTALCLRWLDSQALQDKTCIDYGCGSGVLAIAAVKLNAQKVYATDIDPQALIATQWNAENNAVTEKLVICDAKQAETQQSDIVLANILGVILIELRTTLTQLTKPGGRLILSGILASQTDEVRDAYTQWFDFAEPQQLDDWVLLEGHRHAS